MNKYNNIQLCIGTLINPFGINRTMFSDKMILIMAKQTKLKEYTNYTYIRARQACTIKCV